MPLACTSATSTPSTESEARRDIRWQRSGNNTQAALSPVPFKRPIDRGLRTIGFKLLEPRGEVVARYGKTELARDTWYYVAGVYDADARTMNVYLNGHSDDGYLLETVPPLPHLRSGLRRQQRG